MSGNTKKSIDQHLESHTKDAIASRLAQGPQHSYLKDFIYGAIDGAVTTFAIVAGVAGAGLSHGVIIVLGLANLVADGFSMAVSNYLGTKAEHQLRQHAREIEYKHIQLFPEGETEEVRQIFANKGFKGEDLERVVDVITSDKKRWVDSMLQDELGISLDGPNALRAGTSTFIAFFIIGFIPLISFIINWLFPETTLKPFKISAILTGISFLIVGAVKARFISQHWLTSALETLLIGGIAASIAYYIGHILRGIV